MNNVFYALAFHRGGKPRKWLIYLLFNENMEARNILRRIVHKKNGRVRPRFNAWVSQATSLAGGTIDQNAQIRNKEEKLGPAELQLQTVIPLEDVVKNWRHKKAPTNLLDYNDLSNCLKPILDRGESKLIVSVSHDNYLKVSGGVQLCIQREQALANERGLTYLQIHPWNPLPRLAHLSEDPDTMVSLILNGLEIGTCQMSTLIEVVRNTVHNLSNLSVFIHQLLGHLPEQVAELVKLCDSASCIFWLHDSFSLCPSFNLQRNNLTFCGAPPVTSNACTLCIYGRERINHESRLKDFFSALNVKVVSPSKVTAEFWLEKSRFKIESITITPHIELEILQRDSANIIPQPVAEDIFPIKVAFLGTSAPHKGWPLFTQLMYEYSASPKYHFSVMSSQRPLVGEDDWISVNVSIENLSAMLDAVAANDIDLVLHWPTGRETFSYTTFEAMAGSAYVVTNSGSGNVAAVVDDTGRGAVLSSEDDLFNFFRDGRAEEMVRIRRSLNRRMAITARHSDLSLSFIGEDREA